MNGVVASHCVSNVIVAKSVNGDKSPMNGDERISISIITILKRTLCGRQFRG